MSVGCGDADHRAKRSDMMRHEMMTLRYRGSRIACGGYGVLERRWKDAGVDRTAIRTSCGGVLIGSGLGSVVATITLMT